MAKKRIAETQAVKTGRQQKMVSISAELSERMAEFPDVNWSSVACQAFEMKLGELAAQKEKKTMTDVIARLKASKMKVGAESWRNGHTDGKNWAEEYAEVDELRRIENLRNTSSQNQEWIDWFVSNDDAYTAAERFHSVMFGVDIDRKDAADFWENIIHLSDGEMTDPYFIHGFAEGALNVWDDVKDKI